MQGVRCSRVSMTRFGPSLDRYQRVAGNKAIAWVSTTLTSCRQEDGRNLMQGPVCLFCEIRHPLPALGRHEGRGRLGLQRGLGTGGCRCCYKPVQKQRGLQAVQTSGTATKVHPRTPKCTPDRKSAQVLQASDWPCSPATPFST